MAVDEVSRMLGKLEATVDSIQTHTQAQTIMLGNITDKLTQMNGSIGKAHNRIDTVEEEMITKKSAMKAIIGGGIAVSASTSGLIQALKAYLGIA